MTHIEPTRVGGSLGLFDHENLEGKKMKKKRRTIPDLSLITAHASLAIAVALCAGMVLGATGAVAHGNPADDGVCTRTTQVAYAGCWYDVEDNYRIAVAKCLNETDANAGATCMEDARAARSDEKIECGDVRDARNDVCDSLTAGDGAYDPPIDSISWVPANLINGNTYYPLIPGTVDTFENTDGEKIVVTVTNKTTKIMGVPVRVVTDVVRMDGKVTENTVDWYAEDTDGNVWYFGEQTQAAVEDTKLVTVDGSWEAGVDGAKPGIIMPAVPVKGNVYRQEWLLGDAEDVAGILSVKASASAPAASCASTCVKTHDYSPLEPDASESKFYAPGIGVIVVLDDNNPAFRERLIGHVTP